MTRRGPNPGSHDPERLARIVHAIEVLGLDISEVARREGISRTRVQQLYNKPIGYHTQRQRRIEFVKNHPELSDDELADRLGVEVRTIREYRKEIS